MADEEERKSDELIAAESDLEYYEYDISGIDEEKEPARYAQVERKIENKKKEIEALKAGKKPHGRSFGVKSISRGGKGGEGEEDEKKKPKKKGKSLGKRLSFGGGGSGGGLGPFKSVLFWLINIAVSGAVWAGTKSWWLALIVFLLIIGLKWLYAEHKELAVLITIFGAIGVVWLALNFTAPGVYAKSWIEAEIGIDSDSARADLSCYLFGRGCIEETVGDTELGGVFADAKLMEPPGGRKWKETDSMILEVDLRVDGGVLNADEINVEVEPRFQEETLRGKGWDCQKPESADDDIRCYCPEKEGMGGCIGQGRIKEDVLEKGSFNPIESGLYVTNILTDVSYNFKTTGVRTLHFAQGSDVGELPSPTAEEASSTASPIKFGVGQGVTEGTRAGFFPGRLTDFIVRLSNEQGKIKGVLTPKRISVKLREDVEGLENIDCKEGSAKRWTDKDGVKWVKCTKGYSGSEKIGHISENRETLDYFKDYVFGIKFSKDFAKDAIVDYKLSAEAEYEYTLEETTMFTLAYEKEDDGKAYT